MTVDYNARYSDGYAYKVIYDPTERKTYLATSDGGRMDVPFYLDRAHFVEFYFTGFDGMMGKDAWAARAQMDRLLTAPTKPAEPPKIEPEDTRLHIEPRQPGESSFSKLKEAANRAGEVARAARERERREMLEQANHRDPRKVQQARNTNNYLAARMRPKRGE